MIVASLQLSSWLALLMEVHMSITFRVEGWELPKEVKVLWAAFHKYSRDDDEAMRLFRVAQDAENALFLGKEPGWCYELNMANGTAAKMLEDVFDIEDYVMGELKPEEMLSKIAVAWATEKPEQMAYPTTEETATNVSWEGVSDGPTVVYCGKDEQYWRDRLYALEFLAKKAMELGTVVYYC